VAVAAGAAGAVDQAGDGVAVPAPCQDLGWACGRLEVRGGQYGAGRSSSSISSV
jgi:hypothetical protein